MVKWQTIYNCFNSDSILDENSQSANSYACAQLLSAYPNLPTSTCQI